MKKLLFLAVLGMLTMLVAAPAFAQGLPIVQDPDDCPGETVPTGTLESGSGFSCFPAEFQCEGITDQAAFEECVADGMMEDTPVEEPVSPEASVSCDGFISAAGNPSQFSAQQFFDFEATPEQQAALDVDGDGFACDSLETGVDDLGESDADRATVEAPADTATPPPATTTALPDTGGSSLLALGAGALLVAGGLVMRRR